MRIFIILILLLSFVCLPQQDQANQSLRLTDKTTYKLDSDNHTLPLWITASYEVKSAKIEIPGVVSSDGRIKSINYRVYPAKTDITPSATGKMFKVVFDPDDLSSLDSGTYSVILMLHSDNTAPVKEMLPMEIIGSKGFFAILKEDLDWIQNNFFTVIWNIFESIVLLLVVIFLVKLFVTSPFFKKRNSLNVLPIVNETGKEAEYQGAALGIDDILIYKIQEISGMSSKESLKHYWLNRLSSSKTWNQDKNQQVQRLNVVGGEFSMDLQKLGDVSIGPIKIPLGSISALLLKLFGGNYVSGTLQQYGTQNKLVIRLERKPPVIYLKKGENSSVQYFESTWPSETVKEKGLTEGIPAVVNEMAYRLILELSKDTGTKNWMAYQDFLEGFRLFSDFEKNKTRLDLLRDAISFWRESIKHDPDFATAHYNLGVAYDMDGNTEDAVFRYQKAISLNPELIGARAHFNLARLYWEKYRDEQRTLNELEKAKKLNPDIPDIYNLEGLVYAERRQNYSKEAEQYQKAIQLSKEDPNPVFYYNLSVAKYYMNQLDETQAAGERAYSLYGEKDKLTSLLQTLGVIHYQKWLNNSANSAVEFEKSLNYYRERLLKDPFNKELLNGYTSVLVKLGRFEDAARISRRLIRLNPDESTGYHKLAEALKSWGKHEQELAIYDEAAAIIENAPQNLNIQNGSALKNKIFLGTLAAINYVQNKPAEEFEEDFFSLAQPPFDQTITAIDGELFYLAGMASFKLGKFEHSIFCLNRTIEIYTADNRFFDLAQLYSDLGKVYSGYIEILYSDYLLAERIETGLKQRAARLQSPEAKNDSTKATQKADEAFRIVNEISREADKAFQNASYNYKKAGFLKLAVTAHLDNADFLIKTYKIYGEKVYQLAREECDKAIQIDHKEFESFHVKGNTYYYLRQYVKAIPEYEKSVELNYNLPGAHYCIGLCYYFMGKYEDAAVKFRTIIKLDEKYTSPDDMHNPDAYQRLAMSLEKIGDLNGAVKVLSDAVNIHPDKVKYHILLGQMLKKRNDFDEAAEEFRSALNLDKNNNQRMRHIALAELADIYIDYGADIENAFAFINEALSITKKFDKKDPELYRIRNTIGWICYIRNQNKRAIAFLEKTLSNFLDDPKYHARLAQSYEKYSDSLTDAKIKMEFRDKAISQWKIIINLPGNGQITKLAEEKLLKLMKD